MLIYYEVQSEEEMNNIINSEDTFPGESFCLVDNLDAAREVIKKENHNTFMVIKGLDISLFDREEFAEELENDSTLKDKMMVIIMFIRQAAAAGHHLNVNVLNREKLMLYRDNPDEYTAQYGPAPVIRVSGYAVSVDRLTPEQLDEVIQRTFHEEF